MNGNDFRPQEPYVEKNEPAGCGATCAKPQCDNCADIPSQPQGMGYHVGSGDTYTGATHTPAPYGDATNMPNNNAGTEASTMSHYGDATPTPSNNTGTDTTPLHYNEAETTPIPCNEAYAQTPPTYSNDAYPETPMPEKSCPEPFAAGTVIPEPAVSEPTASGPAIPEPSTTALESLQAELGRLENEIAALSKQFATRIQRTEYDERVMDQMHKELQTHKEDLYAKLVRPILMDVIAMRDSIMRVVAAYSAKPAEQQFIPLQMFKLYADEALDVLGRNSIEAYKSEVNIDEFTPMKHRVVTKTPTADQGLNKKVAESTSDGYTFMGKVISAEKISVYAYDPQAVQPNNEEETSNE